MAEVLPEARHGGSIAAILLGGFAGLALMFLIKAVGGHLPGKWSLVTLVGVDIFIDGVVIGIGFAARAKQGALLLFALTLEILFLGLTATQEMQAAISSRWKLVASVAAGGAVLPLGALAGGPMLGLLPFWLTTTFSFALISLLYLLTEELLVEANQRPDSPLSPRCFSWASSAYWRSKANSLSATTTASIS